MWGVILWSRRIVAGHRVRAVVRDKVRAESAGVWGAPSLADRVDEWVVGDVTDRSLTAGVCDGVDAVISATRGDSAEGRSLGY